MTIKEKSLNYVKKQFPKGSYTIATLATAPAQYKGFKAGAEWMLEKAVEWFKNQEETGIPWLDDYEIRLFRKAMEE